MAQVGSRVPERLLRPVPSDAAGCEHIADQSPQQMRTLLERYVGALRWGRQIEKGQVLPRDAGEDDEGAEAQGVRN